MSVEAMAWVWRQDLPPNGRLVLLAIADHADDRGGNAYPSKATLARKTGYGVRQIKNILDALVASGVLAVSRAELPGRPASRQPNQYQINMDQPMAINRAEWKTGGCPPDLRREVIEAFRWRCHWCGEHGRADHGPDGGNWEIDRLKPGRAGGVYTRDNVVLSCGTCNKRRGVMITPSVREEIRDDPRGNLRPIEGNGASPKPSIEPSMKPSTNPPTPLPGGTEESGRVFKSVFEKFWLDYSEAAKMCGNSPGSKAEAQVIWNLMDSTQRYHAQIGLLRHYRQIICDRTKFALPHACRYLKGARYTDDAPKEKPKPNVNGGMARLQQLMEEAKNGR